MSDKIKNYLDYEFIRKHSDLRSIGLGVFMVILLLVSWSGVKVISTNYDLQKQISTMQQQNEVQQLENNNLKLKNQYLNTDQYLELSAREHFNKAAPGETLLIVPHSVALAHSVDLPKPQPIATPQSTESWYERNFNAWLDFFFHRS
jgi:cell division protein FtsB